MKCNLIFTLKHYIITSVFVVLLLHNQVERKSAIICICTHLQDQESIVAASSKGDYLIYMVQLCPAVLMLFQGQVKLSHRGLPNFLAITTPSQLMLVIHLNSPTYSLRASCRCSNLSCRLSRLVPPLPCKCRILLCRFNRLLACRCNSQCLCRCNSPP